MDETPTVLVHNSPKHSHWSQMLVYYSLVIQWLLSMKRLLFWKALNKFCVCLHRTYVYICCWWNRWRAWSAGLPDDGKCNPSAVETNWQLIPKPSGELSTTPRQLKKFQLVGIWHSHMENERGLRTVASSRTPSQCGGDTCTSTGLPVHGDR